ncbi:MAG: TIGR03619 family F420-dependent LLM class oxidoreductase [Candidatus Binataceae bacterium]
MAAEKMVFGFGVFPYSYVSFQEMIELAKLGETLGYYAITLPEHLLTPNWPQAPISTKYWYDTMVIAGAIAAVTTKVKFLTSVSVVPYHPPVQMAKSLATLDVVSGGRVLYGVGSGWMKAEFRRLGIPFKERAAITEEYLRAMKELWSSDSPRFSGKYVSFEDVSAYPKPVQKNGIKIYIGGFGDGPFRRVAALGDGWYPMSLSPNDVTRGLAQIRPQMEKLGRDPQSLWVGVTGLDIGGDMETRKWSHDVMGANATKVEMPPAAENMAQAVDVAGQYARAGANYMSVSMQWRTAPELADKLEQFAREVMPAFR